MTPARGRLRRVVAVVLTVLACLLVWFGLTVPDRVGDLGPAAFVRLPVEALALVALVLVLPPRAARVTAVVVGLLLGLLTVVKMLDMGFYESLNRPFDSVIDWRYLGSLVDLLHDSFGRAGGDLMLVVAGLVLVALVALMPLALLRLTRVVSRHRATSQRAVVALTVLWLALAVVDVRGAGGARLASSDTATYAYGQVSRVPVELRDQREFARAAARDPLRDVPAHTLLTGLRGKDVLFVFVESYGRVALEDPGLSPGVDATLATGDRRLAAAGFTARSAFLTSPTFGAISWLAHSTLQSGLWADSQRRYDILVESRRLTLARAFGAAGWRTVSDVPANTYDWPQGRFYGFDRFYDSRNVGYHGPRFGYPTMPDQYTLDAFRRLELAPEGRRPVMAEIDLISSHAPWSRTPHMIAWDQVGDGSAFDGMPQQAPSKTDIWRSPDRVRTAYGESVEYSLDALTSFVQHFGDDDLVMVVLGDHQPATVVTGEGADHDVPVTVLAHDPAVLDQISSWGWQDGLNPSPDAPVWRMDAFRDRFLAAFGRAR